MTPFLQLRLWWRRASSAEQISTSLAVALVVALAAWVLVPTGDDDPAGTTVAAGQTAGVDPATGQPLPAAGGGDGNGAAPVGEAGTDETVPVGADPGPAGAPAPGADPAAPGAAPGPAGAPAAPGPNAGAPTAAAGRNCAQGSAPGVTDKEILVGVGLLNLAGPIGNSAVDQNTPEELQKIGKALIDDINARGGIQCRKLVAKFYEGNPINPEQQRANCARVVQDRTFLFIDAGAFVFPPGAYNCVAQQKVPIVTVGNLLQSEIAKFSPYLLSPSADAETAMRDVAFGARDLKLFDPAKGFKKLGIVADDCAPEYNRALLTALAKTGIPTNQISKYDVPCPSSGFAPPNQLGQAVSQHRLDGVTHVIPLLGGGSFKPYTEIAEGQRYRPKYLITDRDGIIVTTPGATGPNRDNFDRGIAITTQRHGLNTTPGLPLDAGTKRCQAVIGKVGLPPGDVFKSAGTMCGMIWTAEAAMKGMRTISRETVFPGAFNAGTVQLPFPFADATFKPPSKVYGGDSWWPIEYQKECNCFKVLDANRRPSFAP